MFTYKHLLREIEYFNLFGYEVGNIGNTSLGTPIPYIFVGDKSKPCIIVQGAIHAREHITSLLIVAQAKYVLSSKLKLIGGIYFVPMLNIDGVRLATEGINFISDVELKNKLYKLNNYSLNFSDWKANINGVDLNVNFDAHWGEGISNTTTPSSSNYIGTAPNSEIETRSLVKFTQAINPIATISYHSKGEIIFWRFFQDRETLFRDYRLARMLSNYTTYSLVDGFGSSGGYKDYCINTLRIPSFTLEVGNDNFAQSTLYSQFDQIYEINRDVPRRLLNTIAKDMLNDETGNIYDASVQASPTSTTD